MRLLLDTHFLVWLVQEPDEITRREWRTIERSAGSTLVSALAIWEIRLKAEIIHQRGKSGSVPTPEAALDFLEQAGFTLAPLTGEVCGASLQTPIGHRDPFDVMMLIHAEQLGARLLTRDDRMSAHPLALVP